MELEGLARRIRVREDGQEPLDPELLGDEDSALLQRLEDELVFIVAEARHQQPGLPADLAVGPGDQNLRVQRLRVVAREHELEIELAALDGLAFRVGNDRVPVLVGREVRQGLPNLGLRPVDHRGRRHGLRGAVEHGARGKRGKRQGHQDSERDEDVP